MISAMHSAVNGITQHMQAMNKTAEKIAAAPLGKDVSRNHVNLRLDLHAIGINANVIKRAYEATGTLVDILA